MNSDDAEKLGSSLEIEREGDKDQLRQELSAEAKKREIAHVAVKAYDALGGDITVSVVAQSPSGDEEI